MADTHAKMDRLKAVLAAYGADPARWPESDRELAMLLAAPLPDVTASLEDARILDSALAHASRPVAPAAAANRLVARVHEVPGNVVAFDLHATTRSPGRRTSLSGRLAIATALAASLVFGIYLGASGQSDWLTPPLLAEESPEYMSAQLDVLDGTLQLFEDHTDPTSTDP
ncbi:MAG TPA: hypothetical protein VMO81_08965 [Aestuariivirgaceae bacterium]|nr:hypothetical protein [Aestuariivirgaceae bacterium]